jgi:hypothetical protein
MVAALGTARVLPIGDSTLRLRAQRYRGFIFLYHKGTKELI